jgi:capsular exopolysaccharide synthesis family protein
VEQWRIVKRIVTGVLRRRKRLVVFSFLLAAVTLVPAAIYLSKEPPRFRSSATVLLEARPDRVPVFQEFSPFRPLPVQLAILHSRSLAESVLDNLPRAAVDDLLDRPYYFDLMAALSDLYARLRGWTPEVPNPRRRALLELQYGRVKFESKGDGLVVITAEASKPQVAIDIVSTYVEALIARTRSFNIDDARTAREFLEQQLADVKRNLQAAEESLRTFTAVHGGVKVPDRSQAVVAQLSQAETALSEMAASRRMIEVRLAALREKAQSQKPTPSAPATPAAPRPVSAEVQRLRTQLAQLEGSLLDLKTRFTDEHPRVLLVKERIAEVQRDLGAAVKEATVVTPAPAVVPPDERVGFAQQVVALETALHTVTAQEEAMRKQVESLRQSLTGLSRSELEYSRLVREVESNRNLHALITDKLTAARIREQGEMKVVKVIDPASYPIPVPSQKRVRFLAAALLLVLGASAGVPAAAEWVNRAVETEDDVEAATGLPVLAVLPRVRSGPPRLLPVAATRRLARADDTFIFSEAVRNLSATIQLALRTDGPRRLLVASPMPGEGKSMLVLNLGMAFGEAGHRVVMADTDFLRPTLERQLKIEAATGLADALQSQCGIEQALVKVGDTTWIAPRGQSLPPQVRGMLGTTRLRALMADLTQHGDVILCDSSPVLLTPDNLFLAGAVDAVILVARAGKTTCRELTRAKALLEAAGGRLLGVVINEMPASALRRHYDRYYRAYYHKREA